MLIKKASDLLGREITPLEWVVNRRQFMRTGATAIAAGTLAACGADGEDAQAEVFDIFEGTGEVQRIVIARRLFGYPKT